MASIAADVEAGAREVVARRWGGPSVLAWAAVAAALFVLVGYPLLWLVLKSLQSPSAAGLTFDNFITAFTTLRYLAAVRNSLELATAVALLDLVIAVPMAWAVVRTDMAWKGFVRACVVGSFIIPGFLGAIAWTLLAGPNAGWLNKGWMALTGAGTGTVKHLFARRPGVCHLALYLSLCIFLHDNGARTDVLGDGGRGRDPRRRRVADHAHGHDPAGPAGVDRGLHHGLPRGGCRPRRTSSARRAGALSGHHDAALPIFPVPVQGRSGSSLFPAAAADHRCAALRPAPPAGAQGICDLHRQGRGAAGDPARPLAVCAAGLVPTYRLAIPSSPCSDAALRRDRQGLGTGLDVAESHVSKLPLHSDRASDDAGRDHATVSSIPSPLRAARGCWRS